MSSEDLTDPEAEPSPDAYRPGHHVELVSDGIAASLYVDHRSMDDVTGVTIRADAGSFPVVTLDLFGGSVVFAGPAQIRLGAETARWLRSLGWTPPEEEGAAMLPADRASELAPSVRPWEELRTSGLLWYLNRIALHPRGHALALHKDAETGEISGWSIVGDGHEIWSFAAASDDAGFARIEATLAAAREANYAAEQAKRDARQGGTDGSE